MRYIAHAGYDVEVHLNKTPRFEERPQPRNRPASRVLRFDYYGHKVPPSQNNDIDEVTRICPYVRKETTTPLVTASDSDELRVRLELAIQRMDDPELRARIGPDLRGADPHALFALLLHRDRRVSTAAHECCVLRYAFIAAAVARDLGMDASMRDDLVQRMFVDLPQVVLRAANRGQLIHDPQGWLAHRAHLVARQMRREELGARLEALQETDAPAVDPTFGSTEHEIQEALSTCIELLAHEHPLWADILRWHYLEGFRLEEIARRLGRAHGTIRNDVMRARGRLAELLRQHFPHFAALMERDASSCGAEAGEHAG